MKTIVVVESGFRDYKEHILKSISEVGGLRIILATGLKDIIDPTWCQEYVAQILEFSYSANNLIEVLESYIAKADLSLDGVLTYVDPSVYHTNLIAHHFKLPMLSTSLDKSIRSKRYVRERLTASGISQAWFRGLSDNLDLEDLIQSHPAFPMIVKPVEMMSSLGVKLVHSVSELQKAFVRAQRADFSGENLRSIYGDISTDVICEEYIEGPEYSVESIVQHGQTRVLGITKKWTGDTGFFDEVGHCFPAMDIDNTARLAIENLVENTHRALGIENSMTHLEFKLRDGVPQLIEINCRLAGDLISEIIQRSTRSSIGKVLASIATGELIADIPYPKETHSVTFVTTKRQGRVVGVDRDQRLMPSTEIYYFVSEGDFITTDDLAGPTRLAAAFEKGLPAASAAIEKRFAIQAPFYTNQLVSGGDSIHVFEANETDAFRLNAIETKSWNSEQRASIGNIVARLKYHARHHLLAYSFNDRRPVGFVAGVPLEQNRLTENTPWQYFANLATLPFPSDQHPKSLYIVSISILPDAPRGTGTALVRGAANHCSINKLSFLWYGIRTPKFAEAEAAGLTFRQYYDGLLSGIFHEDLYKLAVNAGGVAIRPLPSYFDDPPSKDNAILIEHKIDDLTVTEVSE